MDAAKPEKPKYGPVIIDGRSYTIPKACILKGTHANAVYHHITKNGLSPQAAFDTVRPYSKRARRP